MVIESLKDSLMKLQHRCHLPCSILGYRFLGTVVTVYYLNEMHEVALLVDASAYAHFLNVLVWLVMVADEVVEETLLGNEVLRFLCIDYLEVYEWEMSRLVPDHSFRLALFFPKAMRYQNMN